MFRTHLERVHYEHFSTGVSVCAYGHAPSLYTSRFAVVSKAFREKLPLKGNLLQNFFFAY
jgi:hypothetical protein